MLSSMKTVKLKHKRQYLQKKEDRSFSMTCLVLLCLLGFLALTGFLFYKANYGTDVSWVSLFFEQKVKKDKFKLEGVSLGMTPEMVRRLHSNLILTDRGDGEKKGTYVSEKGGAFTTLFLDADGGRKAYRMQFVQAYKSLTESEIIGRLSKGYGIPATSSCLRRAVRRILECRYSWLVSGGVSLNALIRERRDGYGAVRTEFTLNAVDTNLEGKKKRRQQKQRARPPVSGADKRSPPAASGPGEREEGLPF